MYIPLPSGLHCEWASKALAKGKHVLLEKPAAVNAQEAEKLFGSPLLQQPNAPILLEAMHFRFQPAWQYFLSLIDRTHIQDVKAVARLPSYIIPQGGIRFDYQLGGGNMLDLGTYPMNVLRQIMGVEPEECTSCRVKTPPPPYELCDEVAEARFRFPGDRTGEAVMDVRAPLTTFPTFNVSVLHKEIPVTDPSLPKEQEKVQVRRISFNNFLMSSFWHQILIEDLFTIRDAKDHHVIKQWTTRSSKKIYTFHEAGINQPGEPFWTSYRHQLEQFVNRIRGIEGSFLWVSGEDSIAQARMIDMAYAKSGLPLRPSRPFTMGETVGARED